MKKYIKASSDLKTRAVDLADKASEAIWQFQTIPEWGNPDFDILTNEDVDTLDRARAVLDSISARM